MRTANILFLFGLSFSSQSLAQNAECSAFGQLLQSGSGLNNSSDTFDRVVAEIRSKSKSAEAIMFFSRAPERTSFFSPRTLVTPVNAFWASSTAINFSMGNELNAPYWNGRLFIGSVRHRTLTAVDDAQFEDHRLEVISWNKQKSSFEFFIVDHPNGQSSPRITRRDSECRTCHTVGPIFLSRPWDGSDAEQDVLNGFVFANAMADAKKFKLNAINCLPQNRKRSDIVIPNTACPSRWISAAYRVRELDADRKRLEEFPPIQAGLPKIGLFNIFGKGNTRSVTSAAGSGSNSRELTIFDFESMTTLGASLENQVKLWNSLPPINRVKYTSAMIKNFLARDILSTGSEADREYFTGNSAGFGGDLLDLQRFYRDKISDSVNDDAARGAIAGVPSPIDGNLIPVANQLDNELPNGTRVRNRPFPESEDFISLDVAVQGMSNEVGQTDSPPRYNVIQFDMDRPEEGANNFNLSANLQLPLAAPRVAAGRGNLSVGTNGLGLPRINASPDLDIFGFNRESVRFIRDKFSTFTGKYLTSCVKSRFSFGAPRPASLSVQESDESVPSDSVIVKDIIIELLDMPSMRQLYTSKLFPGRTEIMNAFLKGLNEVGSEAEARCYCRKKGTFSPESADVTIRPSGCGISAIDSAPDVTAPVPGAVCGSCHKTAPGEAAAAPQAGFDLGSGSEWVSVLSFGNPRLGLRWLIGTKALVAAGYDQTTFLEASAGETISNSRAKNHGSIEYICNGQMPPDVSGIDQGKLKSLACHLINLCANNPVVLQKSGGANAARQFCWNQCELGPFRDSLPCK